MKKLGKDMDRRKFLRGLGATATALGAGGPGPIKSGAPSFTV
jgi:hypothetical protein